jgi:hypothetical protein
VSTFIRQTQDKAEILNISHAVSNSNSRLGWMCASLNGVVFSSCGIFGW